MRSKWLKVEAILRHFSEGAANFQQPWQGREFSLCYSVSITKYCYLIKKMTHLMG